MCAQLPLAPDGLAAEQAAAEEKAASEARRRWEEDDSALRALRMALREITTKLLCNRHWKEFWEPVDPDEDPEYWELVSKRRIVFLKAASLKLTFLPLLCQVSRLAVISKFWVERPWGRPWLLALCTQKVWLGWLWMCLEWSFA